LQLLEIINVFPRGLNLILKGESQRKCVNITLMKRVQIATTTSRDLPRAQLPGKLGLYSHVAYAFSMVEIFMMWPITATFEVEDMCNTPGTNFKLR